jgi:phosphotransferase system, enzyme I, PtsP
MQNPRGTDPRNVGTEPALRIFMRRLRQIFAEPSDGQTRLDTIVRQVAGHLVAEVCSIYLKRQDGSLELFATEGLNPSAKHTTFMMRGEGLVGRCAELGQPVNEPDAQNHPAFSYRPETGEDVYHSFVAVPVTRGGDVLGVLVVQNRTQREYGEEDLEVLETTAMVLAEHLVSGDVAGVNTAAEFSRSVAHIVHGQPISEGLALGHVVLHESRVVVTELTSNAPEAETARLETAVTELKTTLDELLEQTDMAAAGEHRDVFEAYRMFANDRGWLKRMKAAIQQGLTAEAAVARVQNDTRARMLAHKDSYLRERLKDLDELSDRLLRVLSGRTGRSMPAKQLPTDTVLVARSMGPADLLDYDRTRIKGLVIEDSSGQSHVAIVAKALGIAAVGQARGVMERVDNGDPIIVDAETGDVHIRPTSEVIGSYADKARFRARKRRKYRALQDVAPITRDGERISVSINAGLLVDLPQIAAAGADGIGLFRTELQFMVSQTLPRLERQTQFYRDVIDAAGERPVTFRTLDVGGDKVVPYLRQPKEENPALGWRAIRMALDRPGLLRTQVRALLRAAGERDLRLMLPMVTALGEITAARSLIQREIELLERRGGPVPKRVHIGVMLEVPSLLFQLDRLMPMVDFVSVGSNDLLQYLYASDRNNERVATRYDQLSPSGLRALKSIADAAKRHNTSLTLCGEMASRPLDAMALIGLGYRGLSMAPSAIGPVKSMILALDARSITAHVEDLLASSENSLREPLKAYAAEHGLEV